MHPGQGDVGGPATSHTMSDFHVLAATEDDKYSKVSFSPTILDGNLCRATLRDCTPCSNGWPKKQGQKTGPKSFLLQLGAWPCRVTEGLLLPEKSQPYGVKKMGQLGFLTAISCRLFSSVDVSPWRMGLFVARKEINEFQ